MLIPQGITMGLQNQEEKRILAVKLSADKSVWDYKDLFGPSGVLDRIEMAENNLAPRCFIWVNLTGYSPGMFSL